MFELTTFYCTNQCFTNRLATTVTNAEPISDPGPDAIKHFQPQYTLRCNLTIRHLEEQSKLFEQPHPSLTDGAAAKKIVYLFLVE